MQPVELKRVRTLYACVGEHETELSFEPNQIITNGWFTSLRSEMMWGLIENIFSSSQSRARLAGGNPGGQSWSGSWELCGVHHLSPPLPLPPPLLELHYPSLSFSPLASWIKKTQKNNFCRRYQRNNISLERLKYSSEDCYVLQCSSSELLIYISELNFTK